METTIVERRPAMCRHLAWPLEIAVYERCPLSSPVVIKAERERATWPVAKSQRSLPENSQGRQHQQMQQEQTTWTPPALQQGRSRCLQYTGARLRGLRLRGLGDLRCIDPLCPLVLAAGKIWPAAVGVPDPLGAAQINQSFDLHRPSTNDVGCWDTS